MSTTQVGRGLEAHGVDSSKPVHFNLSTAALYEHAIRRQEGVLAHDGPLVCRTGAHTGDLVFFGPVAEPGRITHVGMMLGSRRFIHAAGSSRVRINGLTDDPYPAQFRGARRFFPPR